MDAESTVELVVDAGVLAPTADGESFAMDPAFEDAVTARHEVLEGLSESALEDRIEDVTADLPEVAGLDRMCSENLDVLAALEIFAESDDVPVESRLNVLPAIDQFLRDEPRDDGSPDGFLAVHGDLLPLYVARAERAIVFVWREHCPTCRIMREEFESIFETPPDDISLISVYGPDMATFLHDQYDVQGGPTTLFTVNGAIDVRLLGAQHRGVIDQEIEYLRSH